MGYVETMVKLENGKELSAEDKLDCIRDVLRIHLKVEVSMDSEIVKRISTDIGSMWEDIPMPAASQDIPREIVDRYLEFVAA
jgi:hypothetical protein